MSNSVFLPNCVGCVIGASEYVYEYTCGAFSCCLLVIILIWKWNNA